MGGAQTLSRNIAVSLLFLIRVMVTEDESNGVKSTELLPPVYLKCY